jgi:hypothetical protein
VGLCNGLLVSLAAGSVRVGCSHCPLRVVQRHTPTARVRLADSDHHNPKSICVLRPARSGGGRRRRSYARGNGGLRQRRPRREGRVPCMHGPARSWQPRSRSQRRDHERRAANRWRRRLCRGRQQVRGKERAERRRAVYLSAQMGCGGICMPDTPFVSSAGQGTLEIITSRGGLLTLRAHPAFSFLAPSASLTVPSLTHASSPRSRRVPRGLQLRLLGLRRACLTLPVPGCPHIWTHCRRAETRCALSSSGPPNPV